MLWSMWKGIDGEPLPAAGDAFLIPVARGVWSFCWVVGFAEKGQMWHRRRKESIEVDYYYLAGASWFGAEPPTARDLERPTVLKPTYAGHLDAMVVAKAATQPPKKFPAIGKVGRASPGKLPKNVHYGAWYAVENNAREQWKFDRDRGAYTRLRAEKETRRLAQNAASDRKVAKARVRDETRTIGQWARSKALLAELPGMMSKRRADELTALVRGAVRALAALAPDAKRAAKLAQLEALVVEINAWHARVGPGVIETAERELLCATIDRLGRAAGISGSGFAEKSRDW